MEKGNSEQIFFPRLDLVIQMETFDQNIEKAEQMSGVENRMW